MPRKRQPHGLDISLKRLEFEKQSDNRPIDGAHEKGELRVVVVGGGVVFSVTIISHTLFS